MSEENVSRRGVLRGVAAGAAASGMAGTALANVNDDQYVVGLEAGASPDIATSEAREVKRTLDLGHVRTLVSGRFSSEALEGLSSHPQVDYIEKNGTMEALAQTLPWGIDRVDADVLHSNSETGKGADIAILDTGIDSDHPDLQNNIAGGKCLATDCCGQVDGGLFCSPNDNTCHYAWDDDHDHGTHCAGIADAVDNTEGVVGVSTEANLYAGKVLDGCGSGYYDDIAAGIQWAADRNHDVASMSLGGDDSSSVQDACQYAYDKGVLLVAAAGNDGECTDCVGYPAAYSTVIAVSATSSDDTLASFSSTGPEVELAAPGENIYSTIPGGYDTFSGTSMACPHVSGAGGQLMANGYSNTDARSQLQSTAEDIGLSSNEQGYGLLDAAAALGYSDGGGGGGDNPPAIDSFSITNSSNGGWAKFDVDWAVSDQDGDLSSVDIVMEQNSSTVDSVSNNVSGSSASGSDTLKDKKGSGSYDITLTVTDGNGNTASQTKTVTA